jgi:hypothetical protein
MICLGLNLLTGFNGKSLLHRMILAQRPANFAARESPQRHSREQIIEKPRCALQIWRLWEPARPFARD